MNVSRLNQALAENLAHHMEEKGLKQMALAKKCGVGQTTISLYLHPERRKPGKDSKAGSAKLTEVEMLAEALAIEPLELLWPLDERQRRFYEQIRNGYKSLPGADLATDPSSQGETSGKLVKAKKTVSVK